MFYLNLAVLSLMLPLLRHVLSGCLPIEAQFQKPKPYLLLRILPIARLQAFSLDLILWRFVAFIQAERKVT